MIATLLSFVRRPAAKPAPPVAMRPPLPEKLLSDLVGLEASRRRRLDDRRRRPRIATGGKLAIVVQFRTGRHTIGAQLRDLSAEGISLDVPLPIKAGVPFTLTMQRVSGDGSVDMLFAVRRCEPLPDGRHFVGAELTEYRPDPPLPATIDVHADPDKN